MRPADKAPAASPVAPPHAHILRPFTIAGVLSVVTLLVSCSGDGPVEPSGTVVAPPPRAALDLKPTATPTLIVNSGDDVDDGVCNAAHCSLREAIDDANSSGGLDVIHFDISGTPPHTIQPGSPLPTVTDPVVIDGATQPGYSGSPIIEIDGSLAGMTGDGLKVTAGGSTIRGLVINRFSWLLSAGLTDRAAAIRLEGMSGNVIEDNYIGTDVTGSIALTNDRNYFDPTVIAGVGIHVRSSSQNAIRRNVISGNYQGLAIVLGANNVVEGNHIGTDATGSTALGNGLWYDYQGTALYENAEGIVLAGTVDNTIGGLTLAERNIITGNGVGIQVLDGSSRNVVTGNYIGTDVSGQTALGSGGIKDVGGVQEDGIEFFMLGPGGQDNVIGGASPGAANVISGNTRAGLTLLALTHSELSGTLVRGNLIGTDAAGAGSLPNGDGIRVTDDTRFTTVQENVVAYNRKAGVALASQPGRVHANRVTANRIFANGELGIDLICQSNPLCPGVAVNDPGDADEGPNELQNYPTLSSAVSSGGLVAVSGALDSTPNSIFTVELFSNTVCDPSGYGEGERYLGSVSVTTDGAGHAAVSAAIPGTLPDGHHVTATATDDLGNTSEFSACVVVKVVNAAPVADAGGPYSGVEGFPVGFDGTGSYDLDGDPLTFAWSFGDGGSVNSTPTPSHTYADNGSYSVALQVDDPDGLANTDWTTATIANAAPTIVTLSGPTDPSPVGATVIVSADFIDPGILDTHTATVDWGDGTSSSGTVSELNGSGNVSGSHVYAATGIYTVMVTVRDKDGATDADIFEYVVVYDPAAGFVTGAGWIDSPSGAYLPDPSLTGSAHFGFVSRYRKGADSPTGNTEFQFRTADLNFHSSSYEFLVITMGGMNAQFKGEGTVNGSPAPNGSVYKFMIWAQDNTPVGGDDTFRIRIWYEYAAGEVEVYDNGVDQAIGGGSVVIHTR